MMLFIRLAEEAIAAEYPKGEMRCPTHLCIGEEAIAVGVCTHLRRGDIVFSTHRSHGHYLAKGGSLSAMIAELYGKATGCSAGIGGSQHLIDLPVNFWGSAPIVASTIPVAVGAALSIVMKREKRIVVCFFGDAAVEEGVFFESVNFAILKKLPVLFVCENNFYSTNTPLAVRQPKRAIYKMVKGLGISRSIREDGNDVVAVSNRTGELVDAIRNGTGPAFIECITYRTLEHCGPYPDPKGFRPEAEKKSWQRRDPIVRFHRIIQKHGVEVDEIDVLKKSIAKRIAAAFAFAKKSPFPTIDLAHHLYAE
jgi:pyruvate dehydrogenase E1 component alpha subunit